MNAQEFAEALVDLKKAVELNPQLPDVFSYYGMALLTTGDMAAAAVAFRKGTGVQSQRFRFQPATGRHLQTGPALRRSPELLRTGAACPSGRSRRALPTGHARPDGREHRAGLRQAGATDQGDAAVRGGARLAGHGLLPAQAQGGRRPGTRNGSEAECREPGRPTRGQGCHEAAAAGLAGRDLGAAAPRRRRSAGARATRSAPSAISK